MKQTLALSLSTVTMLSLLGACSSNESATTAPAVVVGTAPSIALNPNPPVIAENVTPPVEDTVVDTVEEETSEDVEAEIKDVEAEIEDVETESEDSVEPEESEEEDVDVVSSATVNYTSSKQKIIQIEPYLLVADEDTGEAYHLINIMDTSDYKLGQICETMYVHVFYGPENTGDENSLITETCAMFLAPTSQEADMVGVYQAMMEETNLSTYDKISMDLSQVTNLSEAEKEAFWWLVTKAVPEGTEVLMQSKDELTESGDITDGQFANGLLLSFENSGDAGTAFQLTYDTWESDDTNSSSTMMATPDDEGVYTLTPAE